MTKKRTAKQKAKPTGSIPKAEADKARDAALTNMLRTPPKLHKDEPRRRVTAGKR